MSLLEFISDDEGNPLRLAPFVVRTVLRRGLKDLEGLEGLD